MRVPLLVAALSLAAGPALAAGPGPAGLDRYFSVWADNRAVTPANVARYYAPEASYYGKRMTRAEIYADKRAFIAAWPHRSYRVLPGSIGQHCTPGRCEVTAILGWTRSGPAARRAERGSNTITLELVRIEGGMKILRESGTPVVASACRADGSAWRCSGYH